MSDRQAFELYKSLGVFELERFQAILKTHHDGMAKMVAGMEVRLKDVEGDLQLLAKLIVLRKRNASDKEVERLAP